MAKTKNGVSSRGVYHDLTISPYEFKTPYGDIFKFSSAKKLEIYTRDIPKELNRLDKLVDRNNLRNFIHEDIDRLLRRAVYDAFYKQVEG